MLKYYFSLFPKLLGWDNKTYGFYSANKNFIRTTKLFYKPKFDGTTNFVGWIVTKRFVISAKFWFVQNFRKSVTCDPCGLLIDCLVEQQNDWLLSTLKKMSGWAKYFSNKNFLQTFVS